MKRSLHCTALAALVALAPLSAAAAPATVGSPALAWQSMGTLSPAEGQKENIGVAGLLQGTFGDYIIVGGGKQDGVLSKKFYTYDIKTGTLTLLPDFPGEAREQSVAEFLGGRFFVFSGGANVAYTDGYAYDPKTRAWTEIKGPNVDGTPVSLLGARAVRLNADEMLVVGGFNHEIYNWAVSNLSTLQGEEKYAEPRRRVVPLTEHLS